jgi:hypothetical protein
MKKHFKVILVTVDGNEDFAYAHEHNPLAALELAIAERNDRKPWIGEPTVWRVFHADEIDSNVRAEPVLTVAAKDLRVPVKWIDSETDLRAAGAKE